MTDPLHPTGRCTCGGGGSCTWCKANPDPYDRTMRERGILFSAPLVKALLAGAKTQTRRLIKPQPVRQLPNERELPSPTGEPWTIRRDLGWRWQRSKNWSCFVADNAHAPFAEHLANHCPYGVPGDRLWVRETWGDRGCAVTLHGGGESNHRAFIHYLADDSKREIPLTRKQFDELGKRHLHEQDACPKVTGDEGSDERWASSEAYSDWLRAFWTKSRPSIFMPRWASRITLEVTEVRVQRLHDISEDDAKAEGVERLQHVADDQPLLSGGTAGDRPHVLAFSVLWDDINGERASWASNPWVWCVSFRRLP